MKPQRRFDEMKKEKNESFFLTNMSIYPLHLLLIFCLKGFYQNLPLTLVFIILHCY